MCSAYIPNFYAHGQWKAIVKENKIPENSAFQLLEDFRLILKTIATSMKQFTQENAPNDPVAAAFERLSESYEAIFKRAFKEKRRLDQK